MAKKKSDKERANSEPTGLEAIFKRDPNLKTALQQFEKQFGEGSIMPLGGEGQLKVEGIPTAKAEIVGTEIPNASHAPCSPGNFVPPGKSALRRSCDASDSKFGK